MFVLGGCASPLASRLVPPDRNILVRDQLVIHGDFPLAAHHRLFEELTSQRADLCRRLALPCSDEPIHVYLFESPERFEGFIKLHYPQFPDRRAFFVETDTKLSVYAQWGDRMAEDLRHEVTHGYLHSVVPNVPLWLDEGIAKFYEVPRGQRGLNRPLLDRLVGANRARALAAEPAAAGAVSRRLQHDAGRLRGGLGVGPLDDGIAAGMSRSAAELPGRLAARRRRDAAFSPPGGDLRPARGGTGRTRPAVAER